jgi:hypothetical protein
MCRLLKKTQIAALAICLLELACDGGMVHLAIGAHWTKLALATET